MRPGLCQVVASRRRRGSHPPAARQVWQVWQVVPIVISMRFFFLPLSPFLLFVFGKVLKKAATPVTVLCFSHKQAALGVATSCNNLPPTCNTASLPITNAASELGRLAVLGGRLAIKLQTSVDGACPSPFTLETKATPVIGNPRGR